MIYLDYSATTPVNKEVLDSFTKINLDFVGNANSLHKLGFNIDNLIKQASLQIANILNINSDEIIYTSGATEANNLAIQGIAMKYQARGKHIITTKYEHSSVNETLAYLKSLGFEITYVECDRNGRVILDEFKKVIRDDTILVTITAVNSELGIVQPIAEIGEMLKNYPCFFHSDLTQAIGKIDVNLQNVDLATFSAHKIYGLKGIGALVKKRKIELLPLIHGGKSTTIYRSGTPDHPLIASLSKALRLATLDLKERYLYVQKLNVYLKERLCKYSNVYINSNDYSIPHILNISVLGIKAETLLHALEEEQIYVSTRTACSDNTSYSANVLELTGNLERAKSSIRISLSYLTTQEEIDTFLIKFDACYKKLLLNAQI